MREVIEEKRRVKDPLKIKRYLSAMTMAERKCFLEGVTPQMKKLGVPAENLPAIFSLALRDQELFLEIFEKTADLYEG